MSKYKVDICGIDTSKLRTLKNDEMIRLFKAYKEGDNSIKELLIYGNLKLVLSILKKYQSRVDNMDDLFQIGCIGLIKAIDNFDLSYGVKFSTYSVPMIDGEIKRYIRDNNAVRISRSIKETAYRIIKFKDDFASKNNREATTDEIVKYLGIPEYDISSAYMSLKEPMSIFEPIYSDDEDEIYLLDQLEDKKENSNMDEILSLRKAMSKLKKREKDILISRYVIGKTQMEIADEIGISQAQVSRIEKSAILKLKKLID
jgi:RNA polymerase sporulation-specific sigma factor